MKETSKNSTNLNALLYEIFLCSLKYQRLSAVNVINHLVKINKLHLLMPFCFLLHYGLETPDSQESPELKN